MDNGSFKLEETYTKVPNCLIEAMMNYRFNLTEHKIIWFIIRKTYGWNKDLAFISYGTLAKRLGCDVRYIKRLIKRLKNNQVILIAKTAKINLIGLNQDYQSWRLWKTKKADGIPNH